MNRPSRARRICSISPAVPASRGTTSMAAKRRIVGDVGIVGDACRLRLGPNRFPAVPRPVRAPWPRRRRPPPVRRCRPRLRPSAWRRPGTVCSPPNSCLARRMANTRLSSAPPLGFSTENVQAVADLDVLDLAQPAVDVQQHVVEGVVLAGRSARPRSWSIFAARISVQICWRIAGSLPGSSAAMLACSSSNCSNRAMSP